MKRAVACGTLGLLALAWCWNFRAQQTASIPEAPPPLLTNVSTVPAGEGVVLELQEGLNTLTSKKGDRANFTTTDEVLVGGQVAIPRGSTVHATLTEVKPPGRLRGRAQIRLEFNELVLPDGSLLPLAANLSRAGWWKSSGKIQQTVQGEPGKAHDVYTVGQGAAQGAIVGGLSGSLKNAAIGATIGAAVSGILILLERGPDLDLPPGMMFEIELTRPLRIPLAAAVAPQFAAANPPPAVPTDIAGAKPVEESVVANEPKVAASPDSNPGPKPDNQPAENATLAANRNPVPSVATAPPPPPDPTLLRPEPGAFTLKVDVNLVMVEATVRDPRGGIVDNLKRENFRVFEDGVEQPIQHFSQDELPLAVALVVDRSGSIAPVLSELRQAALDTLSRLKPEDQVALFAFAERPERLEYLTNDRPTIADQILNIQAGGGTNITDALFEAALYLGRAARGRRHAIILVSDNQPTVRGFAGEGQVIRLALETETVIYSVKIGSEAHPGKLLLPMWIPGGGSVKKITRETGGEIIDTQTVGSLASAMAAVVARLKKRYTLGYASSNKRQDGAFRRIDVRLADRVETSGSKYAIYARRGYYAPLAHMARTQTP